MATRPKAIITVRNLKKLFIFNIDNIIVNSGPLDQEFISFYKKYVGPPDGVYLLTNKRKQDAKDEIVNKLKELVQIGITKYVSLIFFDDDLEHNYSDAIIFKIYRIINIIRENKVDLKWIYVFDEWDLYFPELKNELVYFGFKKEAKKLSCIKINNWREVEKRMGEISS